MLERDSRISSDSPKSGEIRSEFQRDRDRILYSGHFRRLSGITQVTTPSELHAFHNRLTHTLEVAQISRRIAERASLPHLIDPDVCEAAALAHDLGHPPFGHNGEVVLDKIAIGGFSDCQPTTILEDGYEGNAQSLRILLKLAVRNGNERGLDLTAATLRATIKYPWLRGENAKKPGKFGVFREDETEFRRIWEGLPELEQTLEAQVMDWSDDVAYSTHDFYDFALAGLIPISSLKNIGANRLRELLSSDDQLKNVSEEAFDTVAQSFAALPDPPVLSTSRLTSPVVGMLKEWVSFQIGRYAAKLISFDQTGSSNVTFKKKETAEEEVAILKALTYHFAIASPALAVRQEGEKQILKTLFKVLDESANEGKKLLSEDAQKNIAYGVNPTRVVLDIISSMTDAQAISMYHKLTGISPVSILDVTTTSAF